MRGLSLRLTAAAAAIAGMGTAAVAVAGEDAPAAPRSVVEVTLDEWGIDAGAAPVRAGRVVIAERNRGEVEHDLLIVRTERDAAGLPMGLEGVAPELAGEVVLGESAGSHDHASAAHDHLTPGADRRRGVLLAPGRYVLLCPLPGHYARGQYAVITVR